MIELAVDRDRFPAWYRVIVPGYAGAPLSGQVAARQGVRFSRPGQEALYLSLDKATALAEYQQDNPWLQPGTICTFFAARLRVVDLRGGFDPDFWEPLWAAYDIDWRAELFARGVEPPTWLNAWAPSST